jgi:lysozyme
MKTLRHMMTMIAWPAVIGQVAEAKEYANDVRATADFIRPFEGPREGHYLDPLNIPTWGVGAVKGGYECGIPFDDLPSPAPPELVEEIFLCTVEQVLQVVDKHVTVPLTENQRRALGSLAQNLGETKFARSDVVTLLNRGDVEAAAEAFLEYVWGKDRRTGEKVKLRGLEVRRQSEMKLFRTP